MRSSFRRPIPRRDLEVAAYALAVGAAVEPRADAETARILLAALADIGLGALVGAKQAYVRHSPDLTAAPLR